MDTGHQSVAVARSASSSAGRDGNLTVTELVDRYMAAYAGRDDSCGSRLRWWVGQVGSVRLADLDDDAIFHALEALASGQGRHYMGRDADGKPILKGKGKPPSPATINRYAAALGAVCTWAIRRRLVGWAAAGEERSSSGTGSCSGQLTLSFSKPAYG
ncbi:MAG: hypothetical protein AB7S98_14670 [Burkholderiaceae bacterium]